MPVNLGKPGSLVHETYQEIVGNGEQWEEETKAAGEAGRSRAQSLGKRIVGAGEEAVALGAKCRQLATLSGKCSAKANHNLWTKRLREALRRKDSGKHPCDVACPLLFHPKAGLQRELANGTHGAVKSHLDTLCAAA